MNFIVRNNDDLKYELFV